MLSLLRSRSLQSSWQLPQQCVRRSISTTYARRTELAPEPPTEAEKLAAAPEQPQPPFVNVQEEKSKPETYKQFLNEIGSKYKKAEPRNWLGGEVPFPMNPSFKPPPPISDALRSKMYHEFMTNPKKNDVRALSQRYHLSLKRVDAILRLKGMEAAWIKNGKELQTGFVTGMEKLLGVKENEELRKTYPVGARDWTRYDADEADSLEEAEKRDSSRLRYERQYFESVPEGNSAPITPASLEAAKARAKDYTRREEQAKANPTLMPKIANTETYKTPRSGIQVVTKPGRPTLKFVDVGGKFLDVDERLRRIAVGERRSRMKTKRRALSRI